MSFILDALRKADDRRGGPDTPSLPSLPDTAPVGPEPSALPRRALAGAALVALAAAAFWWSRSTAPPATVAAAPRDAVPRLAMAAAETPAPATPAIVAGPEPDVRPLDREAAVSRPPAAATRPAVSAGAATPGGTVTVAPSAPPAPANAGAPVTPGRVVYSDVPLDADDAQPVSLPAPVQTSAVAEPRAESPPARPARDSDLMMYSEFAVNSRSGAPPLRLDIHVYSDDPGSRFVFVNMRKYREGDRLDGDILVEGITPDGAILSLRGQRFLLPRS